MWATLQHFGPNTCRCLCRPCTTCEKDVYKIYMYMQTHKGTWRYRLTFAHGERVKICTYMHVCLCHKNAIMACVLGSSLWWNILLSPVPHHATLHVDLQISAVNSRIHTIMYMSTEQLNLCISLPIWLFYSLVEVIYQCSLHNHGIHTSMFVRFGGLWLLL